MKVILLLLWACHVLNAKPFYNFLLYFLDFHFRLIVKSTKDHIRTNYENFQKL